MLSTMTARHSPQMHPSPFAPISPKKPTPSAKHRALTPRKSAPHSRASTPTYPNRKLAQNHWKPSALRGGLPDSFGLFALPYVRLLRPVADLCDVGVRSAPGSVQVTEAREQDEQGERWGSPTARSATCRDTRAACK